MLIGTYYETDEIKPLYSLLDSFGVFLNRHKKTIPDNRRKNYKMYIKFVKKLVNVNSRDKSSVKKLQKEIENTEDFPDKQWILEKVKELNAN
jgi:hypothetical protein